MVRNVLAALLIVVVGGVGAWFAVGGSLSGPATSAPGTGADDEGGFLAALSGEEGGAAATPVGEAPDPMSKKGPAACQPLEGILGAQEYWEIGDRMSRVYTDDEIGAFCETLDFEGMTPDEARTIAARRLAARE